MSTPYSTIDPEKPKKRLTALDIKARKGGEPLVSLTAYTAPMAALVDEVADVIIIGDSMGMVLYGLPNTLPISLFTMMGHAKAVVDHSTRALCVFDMPFGSYEASSEQAFKNAAKVMKKTGVQAIKIEGGEAMAETARHLVKNGIPVMGHVGLRPQAVHSMGGFKVQGRGKEHDQVVKDAVAMDEAGVFSTIIEGVPPSVARDITKAVSNPTIGIGASGDCDGQVLVTEDMLGVNERTPKFVKKYADLKGVIEKALKAYARDVKSRKFPSDQYTYKEK